MKSIIKYSYILAFGAIVAPLCQSCSVENEFQDVVEGEGTLLLKTYVNKAVITRAGEGNNEENWNNFKLFISKANGNEKDGLIRRYEGKENLPAKIPLNAGKYVAEAWTGDSVPASYDKMYYSAFEPFEIVREKNTEVNLECKIANVVVSVDSESFKLGAQNLKIYVWNDGDYANDDLVENNGNKLLFTDSSKDGYFMMPVKNGVRQTTIFYKITGETNTGKPIGRNPGDKEITGTIDDVKSGYKYIISLKNIEGNDDKYGGAGSFSILIREEDIESHVIEIYAAPVIRGGGDFNLNSPVDLTQSNSSDKTVYIRGFENEDGTNSGLKSVKIKSDNLSVEGLGFASGIELKGADTALSSALKSNGIEWTLNTESLKTSTYDGTVQNAEVIVLTFKKEFFDKLEAGKDYSIVITAVDGRNKTSEATMTIRK